VRHGQVRISCHTPLQQCLEQAPACRNKRRITGTHENVIGG
jgi:hypothetical protein